MNLSSRLLAWPLALCLAGCLAAPAPENAAPAPSAQRVFKVAEPYLAFTLPEGWRVTAKETWPSQTLLLAEGQQGAARLLVEARPLKQPLDLDSLGPALARVEQDRLKSSGGIPSPAGRGDLGGAPAMVFTYTLAGRLHQRMLAPVGSWLYVADLTPAAGPAAPGVLAGLRLRPASEAPSLQAPEAARAWLDVLDPPRLAQALAGAARQSSLEAEAAGLYAALLAMQKRPAPRLDWLRLREQAQRAAERSPADAQAQRALGLVLLALKQPADAESRLESALRLAPQDGRNHLALALWRNFDPAGQEKLCLRALEASPSLLGARLVLGASLAEQGRAAQARQIFAQILELDPSHAAALAGLARLEMDEPGLAATAQTRLKKAVDLDGSDTTARYNLALLLLRGGQAQAAEEQLAALLAVSPDDAAALNLLGRARQEQGRLLQARQSYEAAAKADPGLAQAFYNLGGLCAGELSDPICARRAFTRFLELEPAGPRAQRVRDWLARHK